MVKSGTPMTVLQESEEWTQVQLADGKEGWVLTQFLQSKVPDAIQLENLRKKYDTLTAEADILKNENQGLKEQVAALTGDLDSSRNEYNTLNSAHETLKTESSEFLELQAAHKAAVEDLAAEKEKTGNLQDELNDRRLTWIIAGASILLIGIILGFVLKPQRRRSSLL
jgi:SH3 domain protein